MPRTKTKLPALLFMAGSLLAGCGGGSSSTGEATLSLDLVDAPVDNALRVIVRINGVSMRSPEGEDVHFQFCGDPQPAVTEGSAAEVSAEVSFEVTADESVEITQSSAQSGTLAPMGRAGATACTQSETREFDLLQLTNGNTLQLLDNISVAPGRYAWIRLHIDEENPGYIELADGQHSLTIPSGANAGLRLVGGFSVTVNAANHLLIDFDLRKSLHSAGAKYVLRPVLRLVKLENAARQKLTGEWSAEDMADCESPMAYLFHGHDAVPDDIGSPGTQPVTTAKFTADESGIRSTFTMEYLAYGDYSLAYACNGSDDAPETDDDISFSLISNVTIGDPNPV